jgi:hypothetical protein
MTSNIKDFIGVFDDVFSKEFCDNVIFFYEKMLESGFGHSRQSEGDRKSKKDDVAVYLAQNEVVRLDNATFLSAEFHDTFWKKCYSEYADEYGALVELSPHRIYSSKIQKTKVGGGYHVWHPEVGGRENADRILFYILYLNDVEDGGETEFLYYPRRVKPKAGRMIVAPAHFTHTHRGNPPLTNEKYIITGWVEF